MRSKVANLEFEPLWAILDGQEYDPKEHALLEIAASETACVHRFPSGYIEKLSSST